MVKVAQKSDLESVKQHQKPLFVEMSNVWVGIINWKNVNLHLALSSVTVDGHHGKNGVLVIYLVEKGEEGKECEIVRQHQTQIHAN